MPRTSAELRVETNELSQISTHAHNHRNKTYSLIRLQKTGYLPWHFDGGNGWGATSVPDIQSLNDFCFASRSSSSYMELVSYLVNIWSLICCEMGLSFFKSMIEFVMVSISWEISFSVLLYITGPHPRGESSERSQLSIACLIIRRFRGSFPFWTGIKLLLVLQEMPSKSNSSVDNNVPDYEQQPKTAKRKCEP